ncbi:hypothetical protein L585_08475 [Pantoea ananatis BRT175]|uniref:hypothetical protein n=1 Tax=Pantoea ananas TaxID=553 RepID=UPI0003B1824E|nr:hypothetical protein [Pantoea ananatis]ERM14354.1 hypothetical protein L585_08475 [Pantoea ananatis BRT175]
MSDSGEFTKVALDTVKERITNRLYMYVFSSVIAANWQNILIIFKSKNDIELTLGIMTFEPTFSIFYFYLPVLIGVILAITMPFFTRIIAEKTASQYYLIKKTEVVGEANFREKMANKEEQISQVKLRTTRNNSEIDRLKSQIEELESQSKAYFNWLKGLLNAYNETGGEIVTTDDLKKLLLKLKEHNAVYDLALVPGFKKLMNDIENMKD